MTTPELPDGPTGHEAISRPWTVRTLRRAGACLLLAIALAGLTACFHRHARRPAESLGPLAPVPPAPANVGRPVPVKTRVDADDYRLSPTDMLEIDVFQEPDLKSELRVSNEGAIEFPLIGRVVVGGLTPAAAARVIEQRLSQGYLINPQVTVTVTEFSKRRFTVLGQVQKPGSYDMPDQADVTVLQAIGMAGGYTRIANSTRVTLMRRVNGTEKIFRLNAEKMAAGDGESAFPVVPGDVITVGERIF